MRIAGFRKGETYPPTAASGASASLLNRNVSGPHSLTAPYTPPQSTPTDPFAAILFTPRVSGVIQVAVALSVVNGSDADVYGVLVNILNGTGLSVTGGEFTDDGWVLGTTAGTPPVIGGTTAPGQLLGEVFESIAAGEAQSFLSFSISKPELVGTPIIIQASMAETGTGHAIAGFLVTGLSVVELP